MDDRLAKVERNLAELQKGVTAFRQDVTNRIDQGFKWSIITVVIGMIITWFGAFLFLARGASLLRRVWVP
jgi:hypothetical protein